MDRLWKAQNDVRYWKDLAGSFIVITTVLVCLVVGILVIR
jgi:hypothetical protein